MDRHVAPARESTGDQQAGQEDPRAIPEVRVTGCSALPARPASMFTVTLVGDVDIARDAELLELVAAFRRSAASDVEVDLTGVEFMDSTGLMAMSRLRAIARQRGGRVRLLHPARPVRRILDVSGFGTLCEIVTD